MTLNTPYRYAFFLTVRESLAVKRINGVEVPRERNSRSNIIPFMHPCMSYSETIASADDVCNHSRADSPQLRIFTVNDPILSQSAATIVQVSGLLSTYRRWIMGISHSCLSASIGLRLAACHAGYTAQAMQMIIPNTTPSTTELILETVNRYLVVPSISALTA